MGHKVDKRDVSPDYCNPANKEHRCLAWNEKKGVCMAISEGGFCLHKDPQIKK